VIGIDERAVEAARKLSPERRLARAHQPDEKEVAPMQRHRVIL
jgi:hypothetical protein